MKRRQFIYTSASSAGVIGLAGCIDFENDNPENPNNNTDENNNNDSNDNNDNNDDSPDGLTNGSFEDDLNGWTTGKDVPDVPGGSGPVDNSVSISDQQSSDGEKCVEFYIEGLADDGTIWLEQEVDLTPFETFKVDAYSHQKSFNILSEVAFFAGDKPDGGLSEVDFNRDSDVQDHEGWKTYEYDVSEIDDVKTVAFGMNVIWETGIRNLFDNARLE